MVRITHMHASLQLSASTQYVIARELSIVFRVLAKLDTLFAHVAHFTSGMRVM